MKYQHQIVNPGRLPGSLRSVTGQLLSPPKDWAFLPAGDAGVTRKVKASGPTWVLQIKRGRRLISKGIWAKETDILKAKEDVTAKRATPAYAKQQQAALTRRQAKHKTYVEDFFIEVVDFLGFHDRYAAQAQDIARQVTNHATPVGSGTVARTQRIPINKRAEAAVIAWMRHQTTAYDSMAIPRIKGRRREVRRDLASQSVKILQAYRLGGDISSNCPLYMALKNSPE